MANRTGPDEHVEAVDKLQKSVKLLQKVTDWKRVGLTEPCLDYQILTLSCYYKTICRPTWASCAIWPSSLPRTLRTTLRRETSSVYTSEKFKENLQISRIHHYLFLLNTGFVFHRKEGDNEFMNIIANEINTDVSSQILFFQALAGSVFHLTRFFAAGNAGFPDCWRRKRTRFVPSGWTEQTGDWDGISVRKPIRYLFKFVFCGAPKGTLK